MCVTTVLALAAFALPSMAQAEDVSPDEVRAIAKEAYIYGYPHGGQLPHRIRLLRGQDRPRIQGAVERDPQHAARLHPGGQGHPDAQLRHAVFVAVPRSADRTDGAHHAGDREEPLFQRPVHRPLHLQLGLPRQPHLRKRRRQLPHRWTRLERRKAPGHQEGAPMRDRNDPRRLPHPALQSRPTSTT